MLFILVHLSFSQDPATALHPKPPQSNKYYLFKVNFNIDFPSKLTSPRDFIPSDFRTKICVCVCISHTRYMPSAPYIPSYVRSNNVS
jgi:hypothetical protein